MARAGAFDLEVAYCALGIDCSEGEVTDFGGCVREGVEGCGFAAAWFADEGYERVAGHAGMRIVRDEIMRTRKDEGTIGLWACMGLLLTLDICDELL